MKKKEKQKLLKEKGEQVSNTIIEGEHVSNTIIETNTIIATPN